MATRRGVALGVAGALVVAGAIGWFSLDKETRGLLATLPTNRDVLFWSQPQRDAAFRALDRLAVLAKSRVVPAGGTPMPLPAGPPLKLPLDVDAYMAGQRSAALLIVHDGKLRLERYGLGFDNGGRWTSFSVAKSITSTLVGAAIKDGYIKSMDDKVSAYIPEMKGSAYDDVSIRQLLTMTSGVKWNEDYADPNSDVAQFNKPPARRRRRRAGELPAPPAARGAGGNALALQHRRDQPGRRPARPGDEEAAGDLPLGEDLGAGRHGAAGDLDPQPQRQRDQRLLHPGRDRATSRASASSSSTARGSAGRASCPTAGSPRRPPSASPPTSPGRGYGYQWWTYDDGTFAARGIFGQGIFIDPKRKVVIVSNANWAGGATDRVASEAREAFYRAVLKAVDDEAAAAASPAAKP